MLSYEQFIEKLIMAEKKDKETIYFLVKGIVSLHEKFEIHIERKLSELSIKNPKIFQIFCLLNEKYTLIKKTKEENSKFLFRKSFKFIKKSLEESKKGMLKRNIKKIYLDTYFENKKDTSATFSKKRPSTRKINQKYLKSLFSNENYFREFENFLKNYEEFVMKENSKKVVKISNHIYQLLLEDRLEEITKIQHLPWLKVWLSSCKTMGEDILKEMKAQKNKDIKTV